MTGIVKMYFFESDATTCTTVVQFEDLSEDVFADMTQPGVVFKPITFAGEYMVQDDVQRKSDATYVSAVRVAE